MIQYKLMNYDIYTDGACLRNPGYGGVGFVVYRNGNIEKTFAQGYTHTTNNRMELRAVIAVLKKYSNKKDKITIWTDSIYVKNGVTQWMSTWVKNDWISKSSGKKMLVKNTDLWKQIYSLKSKNIKYRWVKAHSNNEGNELADKLAREAAEYGPFINDVGYDK